MADFLGTRDSNVAISTDNANRKVLILDTITRFDSTVGNFESPPLSLRIPVVHPQCMPRVAASPRLPFRCHQSWR